MSDFHFDSLIKGIQAGDRVVLGQVFTLLESTLDTHRQLVNQIVEACMPMSGNSMRIGITGVPGVGKSTLIGQLGLAYCQNGKKVGVFAVDPSSVSGGGSILADKTRMEVLSRHPQAFIRPSPGNLAPGGVTRHTRESILVMEAAGYEVILIETIGVGQSETLVRDLVDIFLLLLLPGGGDSLQGIKKGIMECVDLLAINKSDGAQASIAQQTATAYQQALQLVQHALPDWKVPVIHTSALQLESIQKLITHIEQCQQHFQAKGWWQKQRSEQDVKALHRHIESLWLQQLQNKPGFTNALKKLEESVRANHSSPYLAGEELIHQFS